MPNPGPVLTSRSARVAGARRLLQRKARAEAGAFLVDGPQGVREALAADALVEVFVDAENASDTARAVVRAAEEAGVPVHEVDSPGLKSLSGSVTPQGVVGMARMAAAALDDVLATAPQLLVILDQVADPGNAGTVIRVADAAGADAVIVSAGSVDVYNDKCVRSTAGSLFHLPVVPEADTADVITALRNRGVQVLGTSGRAADDLDAFADDGRLGQPTAWVLGNEAHGLSDSIAALCTGQVRIPIHGRAESLNLATAAAVVLYASARALRH